MSARKGFTLVEILIVVVILGILAAIVIPQFTNASESAKSSSLVSQLQTIRSQLELYQVQHNGNYPDLSAGWTQMTSKSNVDQTLNVNGAFGPYLQQDPENPFTKATTVIQQNDTNPLPAPKAGDAGGWYYNMKTGAIEAQKFDEANQKSL